MDDLENSLTWELPEKRSPFTLAKLAAAANPWTRYGLPLALRFAGRGTTLQSVTEADLAQGFIQAIEEALNHFNMSTNDIPGTTSVFHYRRTSHEELLSDPRFAKATNAAKGIYTYASVAMPELWVGGALKKAEDLLVELRDGNTPFSNKKELSRKFHPMTKEGNEGRLSSTKGPSGTFLEYAAALVTILTPCKPAVASYETGDGKGRWALIPDFVEQGPFALDQTTAFISLFRRFLTDAAATEEMLRKDISKYGEIPAEYEEEEAGEGDGDKKKQAKPSKFPRPPASLVSFPTLPWQYGASSTLSLLVQVGEWQNYLSSRPDSETAALGPVLRGEPLRVYLVSDGGVKLETFCDSAVRFAAEGTLDQIFRGLTEPSYQMGLKEVKRKVFLRATERFLRTLSENAFLEYSSYSMFADARALPILERYFMETKAIAGDVVEAVSQMGMFSREAITRAYKREALSGRRTPMTERDWTRLRHDTKNAVLRLSNSVKTARTVQEAAAKIGDMEQRVFFRTIPGAPVIFSAMNRGEIGLTEFQQMFCSYLSCAPSEELMLEWFGSHLKPKASGDETGGKASEGTTGEVDALASEFDEMMGEDDGE